MGWVEKLPSGKWRASYRDSNGKTVRVKGSFTHKAAARRAADEAEAAQRGRGGIDREAAFMLWRDWCAEWQQSRSVEASTQRRDESRIRARLIPKWGDVPLNAITRYQVKKWIAEMREDGLAASSAARTVALLSASLQAAVDAEILDANPAARLKLRAPETQDERVLSAEEQARLVQAMLDPQARLLTAVLLGTGLRWGEAAALKPRHIDFVAGTIRVSDAWDVSNRKEVPYPKSKRRRTVPLPAWLAKELKAWTQGMEPGEYIFAGEGKQPVEYANWRKRHFLPALQIAGITWGVKIHTLRHTYATTQLEAGTSIADIATLLGHSTMAMAEKYAHRRAQVAANAAQAIPDPYRSNNAASAEAASVSGKETAGESRLDAAAAYVRGDKSGGEVIVFPGLRS